ncbi:hypothetical protein NUM3379_18100 [Kineococcus sp. NUM-3379]
MWRGPDVDIPVTAGLVVVLALAVVLDAPPVLRTALLAAVLGGLVAVVHARSARGRLEALGLVVAGALTVAVLGGVLLAVAPAGLSRPAWAVLALVAGLGALARAARRQRRPRAPRPPETAEPAPARHRTPEPRWVTFLAEPLRQSQVLVGLWAAVTVIVTGSAVLVGVVAAQRSEVPPLQMWSVASGAGTAVELSAPGPQGPFDLWLEQAGQPPRLISSALVLSGTARSRYEVPAPTDPGRPFSVVLRVPGRTDALRTVTVVPDAS